MVLVSFIWDDRDTADYSSKHEFVFTDNFEYKLEIIKDTIQMDNIFVEVLSFFMVAFDLNDVRACNLCKVLLL